MKNAFLEIITAAFFAGEVKVYDMSGEYFEIIDSAYPVTVRLVDKYGAQRGIMRDAETSFFIKAGDFDTIEITSAQAQTIRFAFGTSEAGTRRTAGVVQVIDGSKNRSLAGVSYVWRATSDGVNINHAQLWNPPGSGRDLIVDGVVGTHTTQNTITLTRNSAPLATLSTNVPINVRLGAAPASVAQGRIESSATVLIADAMASIFVAARGLADFNQAVNGRPILVPPGQGLVLIGDVAGGALSGFISYFEEVI